MSAPFRSWLTRSSAPASIILVRLAVGLVFFLEGVLKFMSPAEFGAGRFSKIGIPFADFFGPSVATVETVCGALLILGLLTRLAAIPLIIDITVAIVSTKIPILLGRGYWHFSLTKLPHYGFLSMMHEARTDYTMLLCLIFLLIVGAGAWSLDGRFLHDPKV